MSPELDAGRVPRLGPADDPMLDAGRIEGASDVHQARPIHGGEEASGGLRIVGEGDKLSRHV